MLASNDTDCHYFLRHFIRAAPRDIFDEHLLFDNASSANDIWKFLKMLRHFDDFIFERFILRFRFNALDDRFHFDSLLDDHHQMIVNVDFDDGQQGLDIDWSQIPQCLHLLHVSYSSDSFRKVDLSSMEQHCSLQSLIIRIKNGFVVLPDYSLPDSLNVLEIRSRGHQNESGKLLDYRRLWSIAVNVQNLTLCEPNLNEINSSDFEGIENMENPRFVVSNFDHLLIEQIKKKFRFSRCFEIISTSLSINDTGPICWGYDLCRELAALLSLYPVSSKIILILIVVGMTTFILILTLRFLNN